MERITEMFCIRQNPIMSYFDEENNRNYNEYEDTWKNSERN